MRVVLIRANVENLSASDAIPTFSRLKRKSLEKFIKLSLFSNANEMKKRSIKNGSKMEKVQKY